MKFNWKTAGLLGLIGAIIVFPITVWKTSRLGRIVYIAVFVIVVLKLIAISIDELILSYVRIQRAVAVAQKLDPVFARITSLEKDLETARETFRGFTDFVENKAQEKRGEYEQLVKDEADKVLARLDEVYKAAEIYKEEQRRAIKSEIIKLREEVKIGKRSIDESVIRERLETVAETRFLLTNEEKERFNKDLEEIGFKVEKVRDDAIIIYSGRWNMVSSDSVSVRYLSSDSSSN